MADLEAERAALRQRQGGGARYDAPGAPAERLAWARLGTAYFSRKLNELDDAALDAPVCVPGWSRRHLVAHVGYQARGLSLLLEALRTGTEAEPVDHAARISHGATLPPRALRALFRHSAVHLDVEWRDLGSAAWAARMRGPGGRDMTVGETPLIRARLVWFGAIAMGNGGRLRDVPEGLREALGVGEDVAVEDLVI